MGDWCGSNKDRYLHQMKNRVQKRERPGHGGQKATLKEII